ncbi:MAG: hypothetical protein M3N98_02375 [Actinomycetota bacterium]|nr:hypothetical protein [Actinomycetota bacterium]
MITRRRIVISIILAAAVAVMVFGFTQVRPTNQAVLYKDPAILDLTPKPGDLVLRETRVGVTLSQAYTLAYGSLNGMAINRIGIPQDQLDIIAGLNQYYFYPAPGKEISELPVGRVCVDLRIRRVVDVTDPGRQFSSCFQTH